MSHSYTGSVEIKYYLHFSISLATTKLRIGAHDRFKTATFVTNIFDNCSHIQISFSQVEQLAGYLPNDLSLIIFVGFKK